MTLSDAKKSASGRASRQAQGTGAKGTVTIGCVQLGNKVRTEKRKSGTQGPPRKGSRGKNDGRRKFEALNLDKRTREKEKNGGEPG